MFHFQWDSSLGAQRGKCGHKILHVLKQVYKDMRLKITRKHTICRTF